MKLNKFFKRSSERYSLSNDQNMKNIDNFICTNQVVSLFKIEGDVKENLFVFDKMLRDYKDITKNLALVYFSNLSNEDVKILVYIVKEKIHQKYSAHVFFEFNQNLHCLIFNIDIFEKTWTSLVEKNPILGLCVDLIKEQI